MIDSSPGSPALQRAQSVRCDPVIQEFLRRIAPLRDRLEKIILFGSRARGDEKPSSDYDILIVVEEKQRPLIDALYDAAQEVLFVTHRLISFKIYKRVDFERFTAIPTPFMANVLREGIPLG